MSLDIYRRTRNLYKKYRTKCPFTLARILKIVILFLDLPEGVKGYCDRVLRRKYIVIDSKLPEEEQAFIAAHELGHMILHGGINHYFITRETYFPIGKFEREANVFATNLLVCGESKEIGEPDDWFLLRCGIPSEMHRFYKLHN